MNISPIVIIWCDVTFQTPSSYQSMKDEFNDAATATAPQNSLDAIDMKILNEGREELRSNDVPLITVFTTDDALRDIRKNQGKKIFVICSGTVSRYLVPVIVHECPYIHYFYIYTHNIALHVEWAEEYDSRMIKMFNFHTTLLLRLTRDIAGHFIEQGTAFLMLDAPRDALTLFNHARNLEIGANLREKIPFDPKSKEPNYAQPDFRDHLDQLEGDNGLIARAQAAARANDCPIDNS